MSNKGRLNAIEIDGLEGSVMVSGEDAPADHEHDRWERLAPSPVASRIHEIMVAAVTVGRLS